jgi:hypothetical protein
MPPKNILDKILKVVGKKRKVIVPENIDKIYLENGPYVQIQGKREGFFKTLFGKKDK